MARELEQEHREDQDSGTAGGQACPGSCNGRWREAMAAYDEALAAYDPLDSAQERPVPPNLLAWPGEPVWCTGCQSRIRQRLSQLDRLAALLAFEADGHGEPAAASEHVRRSSDPASPSPAADDLDELTRMLIAWEDAYWDIRGWGSPPPRGDLASAQSEVIASLGLHLRGILACDFAADFGAEILAWHRGMKRSARAGTEVLRKPLRCPRCHYLTLTWEEGSDRVDCGNDDCCAVMSYAEYEAETERLALALARGETSREEEMA